MIINTGCDIVEHQLTEELGWLTDRDSLNRIFSKNEIKLFDSENMINFLTGRFAAKEAILKCLGTGMQDGLSLKEIEVMKSKTGKPFVILHGEVKKIADILGINRWHITITHSRLISISFVVAEHVQENHELHIT